MLRKTEVDTLRLQWPSKQVEVQGAHKFLDIVGILPQPGQGPKFRDCPGHTGTVGNYVCFWQVGKNSFYLFSERRQLLVNLKILQETMLPNSSAPSSAYH